MKYSGNIYADMADETREYHDRLATEFENKMDAWYDHDWYAEMVLELESHGLRYEDRAVDYVMDTARENGERLTEKEFVEKYEDYLGSRE